MFSVEFCLIVLFSFSGYHHVFGEIYKNFTIDYKSPINSEIFKNADEFIRLKHYNLPTITEDLTQNLTGFRRVEIEDCNVSEIRYGALAPLGVLEKLSLKRNAITEIRQQIFSNFDTEELDLSENKIYRIIYMAFWSLRRLKRINLSKNRLVYIVHFWFHKNNQNLRDINLEHNLITYLHEFVLFGLNETNYINLILSYNRIKGVAEYAFYGGPKYGKLYLDHNNITYIAGKTFAQVSEIKDLRLDHNNITYFYPNLTTVKKYDFRYNPWDPRCLSRWERLQTR